MANEAVKRYDESAGYGGVIQDYIVADGTGIEKGTILKLTDPKTAAASDTSADMIAGIAAREKIASDGRTRLAVYKKGYFDVVASGAIAIGQPVQSAGNNIVELGESTSSGAGTMGYAEEAASNGETFLMRLDL